MDRKTKRLIKRIFLAGVIVLLGVFVGVGGKFYFDWLDVEAAKREDNENLLYVSRNNKLNAEGLYVSNVKENLISFLEGKNAKKVTYRFEGEGFYLILNIDDSGDEPIFSIEKVIDENQEVNALITFNDVESVEYRTGNVNTSTIIKVNTSVELINDYIAITEGTHYLLGEDIKTISYKDDQFYYLAYNLKYISLREVQSCTKEVKDEIPKFNQKDYYYKYGKINFLEDYYQKLASKTFTVKDRCEELEEALTTSDDNSKEVAE